MNPKKAKRLSKQIEPYFYLLPAFVFLIGFVYYPFVKNGWLSLNIVNQFREIKNFAGLKNYARVLSDPDFLQAVRNTFVYVLVTIPISMVIAYFLACLARKKRKTSLVYETLFALSMATSDAVMAMIFQLMYSEQMGIINKLLDFKIGWLTDPKYALLSLMIIQIWHNIGYNFLFMLSALRGLPQEVIESANLDGSVGLTLHRRVILPMISPTMFFLLIKDIAYDFDRRRSQWKHTDHHHLHLPKSDFQHKLQLRVLRDHDRLCLLGGIDCSEHDLRKEEGAL